MTETMPATTPAPSWRAVGSPKSGAANMRARTNVNHNTVATQAVRVE